MSLKTGTRILLYGAAGMTIYAAVMQIFGYITNSEYHIWLTTVILYVLSALFYEMCM